MANTIAFRNYLRDNLLINGDTATQIAVTQGYDDMSKFRKAKRANIEDLCRNVRKTRVTPAPNAAANAPTTYHTLNAITATILHQIVQYANYVTIVDRVHSPQLATQDSLDQITEYFEGVNGSSESDPDLPVHPTKYDNKNSITMLEKIDTWIESSHGRKCVPLAAYIRVIDPLAVDPGFLQPSPEEELLDRAILVGAVFRYNNGLIWEMIFQVTHETTAWSLVKGYKTSRNGRGAYQKLVSHYRGTGHQNRVATTAETTLSKTFYTGTRRFSFQDFTARLTGAFEDLAATEDPRTEQYKVKFMLARIHVEKLRPACSAVRNTQALLNNFEEAVAYIAVDVASLEAESSNSNNPNLRNLSTTDSNRNHGGGRGRGRGGGRGNNGGGRGNGGRGGQGGNSQGGVWSENGRIFLNNGTYPPNVWRNEMTANDRAEVQRQRARADSRRERQMAAYGRDGNGEQEQTGGSNQGGRGQGGRGGRGSNQDHARFPMTHQRGRGRGGRNP